MPRKVSQSISDFVFEQLCFQVQKACSPNVKNLLQFAARLNILAGVHSPRDPFTICKWKDFPFERNTDVTKGATNFTASFYSMNFAKTLPINDITSVLRSAPAAAFGGILF